MLRSLASKGAANIDLLDEALRLNHALVKQPGENEDITVSCSRDLLGFYRSILIGEPIQLKRQNVNYAVSDPLRPGRISTIGAARWSGTVIRRAPILWHRAVEVEYAGHY